jgi:asparagine synthase (glutamine-hydrolysing)
MPGIIGYFSQEIQAEGEQLLLNMARALHDEKQFEVDVYHDAPVGLGRVSLGIASPEKQPVWNENKTCCIVMEGEIFDFGDLKQNLINSGYSFSSQGSVELVLHLYEEYGLEFASLLNGSFVAAVWDSRERKLVIANDRLGLHPLYFYTRGKEYFFASGVRSLLQVPGLPRQIDRLAIAQFLTFDHLLGQRTLLKDVQLLPQASVVVVQDSTVLQQTYWTPVYPVHYSLCQEEEWMERLLHHLQKAVQRQATDALPAGLLLSGGLDSRVLLALLHGNYPAGQFSTYTFGLPGSDDARYADESAKKIGAAHRFIPMAADWLLQLGEKSVRLTDGLGNIVNLHALATLEEEAQNAKVLYKGFLGDAMMGFAQRQQHWATYDDQNRIQAHWQVHKDQGVITFDRAEQKSLFSQDFLQEIGDGVMESYRQGMDESGSSLLSDQRLVFDFRQRVPRMTINGVEVARSRANVRLPFADRDLVDFVITIPPGLRYDRRLMRNTFMHYFPEMAKIPLTDTGLPMLECSRTLTIQAGRFLRWHLYRIGFKQFDHLNRKPYKDYNTWFRTILRSWVEDLLLDSRALNRGYFKPEFVRDLVREHMAGQNHTVRLGALLSLEIWHRSYMD